MPKGLHPLAPSEPALVETREPRDAWTRPYALWRRRWLIAACVAVAVVGALTASLLMPTRYQGRVTLLVRQSRLADVPNQAPTSTVGFTALLSNAAIMDGLVRDLKLDQPPFNLSRDMLFTRFGVEEVRGMPLVRASFVLETPEAAMATANEFAKRAIALNREINDQETRQNRDVLGTQRDEARERLDRAEAALLEFKSTAQLELARRDVDALLDKRTALLGLKIEIEALKSRLAESDRQVAGQSQTIVGARRDARREADLIATSGEIDPSVAPPPRTGVASGVLLPKARPVDRQEQSIPQGSDTVNPVWEVLTYQSALGRTRLQQLEREYTSLVAEHGVSGAKLAVIDKLGRDEVRLARLELEREIERRVVSDISLQYEQAKVRVASRSTELQLIDPAISARTIRPRRLLWAVAGALAGLAFGVVLALLLDEVGRVRRAAPAAPWTER